MSKPRMLKQGMRGKDVEIVRAILCSQGFHSFDVHPQHFGESTHDKVVAFQASHIDPRSKKQLDIDGIVGPATMRALNEPSGEAQRNGFGSVFAEQITGDRKKVLEFMVKSHRDGTREIPDGSNWGDGVSKILANAGSARAWCMHGYSHWFKQGTGAYPMKRDHGHVLTFWREAMKKGFAHTLESGYKPIPGDAFIILYRNSRGQLRGTGHTGGVLTRKGISFNTIEGNAGNRTKAALRNKKTRNLVGFVNLFGDAEKPPKFDQFLLSGTDNLDGRTR